MPGLGSPEMRSPTTGGRSMERGWPSMAASASMPPTPQPSTPSPLTMVVCESVPDEGVAEGTPVVGGEHQARQVLEVDLVADARAGRDEPEAAERALGPAQQLVALDVARVLDGDVAVVGGRVARALDDDRVVDHELDRDERVDLRRVAPEAGQRVAHGGQVDHAGHAGEVLHEHALGGEGDLVGGVAGALTVALGVGAPGGHGHDVVGRDVRAVLVAQEVLEDHLDRVGQAGRRRDGRRAPGP